MDQDLPFFKEPPARDDGNSRPHCQTVTFSMKTTDKKRPVLHCIEPEPDKKQCDNEDVIEFIAFLMSEHSKEEKIDAICNH